MTSAQFTIDRLYTKDLYVNGAQITHPDLAALLTIHPSNNVGIGTNDPKVRLDINGTNALRLPAGNKTSDRPSVADSDYCIRYNTDDNIFEGYSNGAWGSLGGVTSINQKVTITADNNDGLQFYTSSDGVNSIERMHILNDGTVNIGSINDVESVINSKAATTYVDTQITNLIGGAPGALDTLNELAAALGDDANYATTVTNSLALKAPLASPSFTGNVGIGETEPDQKLHINGGNVLINEVSSGTAAKIEFKPSYYIYTGQTYTSGDIGKITFTNKDTNKPTHITGHVFSGDHIPSIKFTGRTAWNGTVIDIMTIRGQSGRVGIGTTSPDYKLDVRGSGNQIINVYSTGGTNSAYARFSSNDGAATSPMLYVGASTTVTYLNSRWDYPMVFYQNNSEVMRIHDNGNVGIGTDSPKAKLDIDFGSETGSLLRFGTERPWHFTCDYTGSSANLNLVSSTDNKQFNIKLDQGVGGGSGTIQNTLLTCQVSSSDPYIRVTGKLEVTGDITAYYSDERLKTFKGKITEPLAKIKQINGYYFVENELAKSLG